MTQFFSGSYNWFTSYNVANAPNMVLSNTLNIGTVINGVTTNASDSKAYLVNQNSFMIFDLNHVPWSANNIKARYNLNGVMGTGVYNYDKFAVFSTTNGTNTNNLLLFDVSTDSFKLLNTLNLPISSPGSIDSHPSDPTILYISNISTNLVKLNKVSVWVVKIDTVNNILILMNTIGGAGLAPILYGKGFFTTWREHVYYIYASSDGYFNIFLADAPLNPLLNNGNFVNNISSNVLPPVLSGVMHHAITNVANLTVDSNFNFYASNNDISTINIYKSNTLATL